MCLLKLGQKPAESGVEKLIEICSCVHILHDCSAGNEITKTDIFANLVLYHLVSNYILLQRCAVAGRCAQQFVSTTRNEIMHGVKLLCAMGS